MNSPMHLNTTCSFRQFDDIIPLASDSTTSFYKSKLVIQTPLVFKG